MLEIFSVLLFCWLFFHALRLTFKIAWGLAKVIAIILFILALPTLIGCLLYASGMILLLPVVLLDVAWGILKAII